MFKIIFYPSCSLIFHHKPMHWLYLQNKFWIWPLIHTPPLWTQFNPPSPSQKLEQWLPKLTSNSLSTASSPHKSEIRLKLKLYNFPDLLQTLMASHYTWDKIWNLYLPCPRMPYFILPLTISLSFFSHSVSQLIVPKTSLQYSLRGITLIIYFIWNILIFCSVHSFK